MCTRRPLIVHNRDTCTLVRWRGCRGAAKWWLFFLLHLRLIQYRHRSYEFDMEVGRKAMPVRLLEDVNRWDFVDCPIFRSQADVDDTTLAEIGRGIFDPTLPPFHLASHGALSPGRRRRQARFADKIFFPECLSFSRLVQSCDVECGSKL